MTILLCMCLLALAAVKGDHHLPWACTSPIPAFRPQHRSTSPFGHAELRVPCSLLPALQQRSKAGLVTEPVANVVSKGNVLSFTVTCKSTLRHNVCK